MTSPRIIDVSVERNDDGKSGEVFVTTEDGDQYTSTWNEDVLESVLDSVLFGEGNLSEDQARASALSQAKRDW